MMYVPDFVNMVVMNSFELNFEARPSTSNIK